MPLQHQNVGDEANAPTQEAVRFVQDRLLLNAVRALMESHPNPPSFRESWAHIMGITMRDLSADVGGNPELFADVSAAYRMLLPVWETYFPDSEAARSKPDASGPVDE